MSLEVIIRPESAADLDTIEVVIATAFEHHPYSNHKEQCIVAQLRESSALTVSLVAEHQGNVIGHIAFSAVTIGKKDCAWYGLAPVAVAPEHQGLGVGIELIQAGLAAIKQLGAKGCVLLGEPEYYQRFGFKAMESLVLEGVPAEYFLSLPFADLMPSGQVEFHQAFADNG